MINLSAITNRLTFRIIAPLMALMLIIGFSMYAFFGYVSSDFVARIIKDNLEGRASDIYTIIDRSLDELIRSGLSGDEKATRIKKALTLSAVEDSLRQNDIKGAVFEQGGTIFITDSSAQQIMELSAGKLGENTISHVTYEGNRYYLYSFEFEPWNWRICLIKDETGYAALMNTVKIANLVAALVLLLVSSLFAFYMGRTIESPLRTIIDQLKHGQKPAYKGINELEFLSDNIGGILDDLQKKKIYLDSILNSSTDTAIVATTHNYGITYFNPAAEKLFSCKSADAIGRNLSYIRALGDNDSASLEKTLKALDESGEQHYAYQVEIEGTTHHIDTGIYKMLDENGGPAGYVLMAKDITDYKHLEEKLLHSQKLEAVGLLAGGVAHEFNNILMAILGYASLLKETIGGASPYKAYVESILSSSERAVTLTRGLLAFSRKQIINPKPVNINGVVARTEGLLTRIIGEDIELKTVICPKELIAVADSGQIEQVLMNLATNARDAMPTGGMLTIETDYARVDNENRNSNIESANGEYAVIAVSDTGIGMDENTKAHIFEPFFTRKDVGKGTGLGLSIVFGIIKQHNGNITVYSEPGKGTTFRIYLPLTAKTEQGDPGKTELPPPQRGTETILLSEDDEGVRKLVHDILSTFGYTVISAESQDAVKTFEQNRADISMLLLDVVMPKKNGKEIYDDIRKIVPDVKVLFMSGYTANIINKSGLLEEGVDFISKPILPDVLLRKVRAVIDKESQT